ncbi:hypothetical protein IE81DRAFT_247081 [Ceraceosorus guamensis]|uniref:Uncharacterized protein n=1 Tax=Ceraceosorus guamensis TaxID=1522189 RepID=A0A316VRM5_9BASI|nr:hypothetical protein IE81DRAFT_247081 [Ceraceosorus guamensis]PWN40010.1 hypothetical protein IE81DRAFT_247081 [Ceraceosorus guamensis]
MAHAVRNSHVRRQSFFKPALMPTARCCLRSFCFVICTVRIRPLVARAHVEHCFAQPDSFAEKILAIPFASTSSCGHASAFYGLVLPQLISHDGLWRNDNAYALEISGVKTLPLSTSDSIHTDSNPGRVIHLPQPCLPTLLLPDRVALVVRTRGSRTFEIAHPRGRSFEPRKSCKVAMLTG